MTWDDYDPDDMLYSQFINEGKDITIGNNVLRLINDYQPTDILGSQERKYLLSTNDRIYEINFSFILDANKIFTPTKDAEFVNVKNDIDAQINMLISSFSVKNL